jgi:hypothetical protein
VAVSGAVYLLLLVPSKMAILVYRGAYARVFMDLLLLVLLDLGTGERRRGRYALLLACAAASAAEVGMRIFT